MFEHAQTELPLAVRRAVGDPSTRAAALADALKPTMAQVIADRPWPPATTVLRFGSVRRHGAV